MAKLEIPLNMNPSLTAALEKVSAYAGRLETERKELVDKLNHAESVIHDLTGDKELLKSELERSRDMANYSHGQLYLMNEYCLKNGFEFVQNNPALTMIHEMEKLRSERDALAAKFALLVSLVKEAAEADESKDFLGHDWHDKYYDECTSAQCLAEIKAEAGRAGFIAGRSRGIEYFKLTEAQAADEYAAKIRNTGTCRAVTAAGIIAGCSSADNEVTFLVQALKDVANPLERFNRLASLSDGKINGMVVANLLKDPETYRDIAEEALKQHTEKIRNTGTWLKDSNVNGGNRQGGAE